MTDTRCVRRSDDDFILMFVEIAVPVTVPTDGRAE